MFTSLASKIGKSLITWSWTKHLLHWILISAGTMAECVFLVASLWMSLNSSVHKFVLIFFDEPLTVHLTELSTAAYVGLPECIVGLAVVTTWGHVKTLLYTERKGQWVWIVLFGIPTIVFAVLSLVTVGCAVANVGFQMPTPFVIARALAGYIFAFASLLYTQLGQPQEKERLQEKDNKIALLEAQYNADVALLEAQYNADVALLLEKSAAMLDALLRDKEHIITTLTVQLNAQNAEIESLKQVLHQHKNTEKQLIEAANKSDEMALQAYSAECIQWLKSADKTVRIDEITRYTGFRKTKIENAITKGLLQVSTRNKELILVSSLVPWLKSVQPNQPKTDEVPALHLVNG